MRFTPAHAGNTHVNAEEAGSLEVHPRSRGEYVDQNPTTWKKLGSSPLTRGNTPSPYNFCSCLQVHPRSRGEYDKAVTDQTHVMGSSPLTRGIPGTVRLAPVPGGFIPAHAGNTDVYSVPY